MNNSEINIPGLYVGIKVEKEARHKLLEFCSDLGLNMSNADAPFSKVREELHTTVLAAKDRKNHNEDSVRETIKESEFFAKPKAWKLLPNSFGTNCLVLELESEDIQKLHNIIKQDTGLKHNFDDYNMHITVHYNYDGELPKELPQFKIKFNEIVTKPYHVTMKSQKMIVTTDNPMVLKKEDGKKIMPSAPITTDGFIDNFREKFQEKNKSSNEVRIRLH